MKSVSVCLALAAMSTAGCDAGADFSDSFDDPAFDGRGHQKHKFDSSFPNALTDAIDQCNTWPIQITPDTTEVDLLGHCTPDDMGLILVSHLDPADQTTSKEIQYMAVLSQADQLGDLRLPMGDVFPRVLRDGIEEGMRVSLLGEEVDPALLECGFDVTVDVATDLNTGVLNLCRACDDIMGFEAGFCEEHAEDCVELTDTCELLGWEMYREEHCTTEALDLAAMELSSMDLSWGFYGHRPAMQIDLDFPYSMKVAEMRVQASALTCGGEHGDAAGIFAPLVDQAFLRGVLADALPLGEHDVILEGFDLDIRVVLQSRRGQVVGRVVVDATIAALQTDSGLPLTDYVDIGELERDIERTLEVELRPAADQLAALVDSVRPTDHKVCLLLPIDDANLGVVGVELRTGPMTDSCREANMAIWTSEPDEPACETVGGMLYCVASQSQNPDIVDPNDFDMSDAAARYTWVTPGVGPLEEP